MRFLLEWCGWYFEGEACSSGLCHLDPAEPGKGQGGCRSHGPDRLSACQCANLQPAASTLPLPCSARNSKRCLLPSPERGSLQCVPDGPLMHMHSGEKEQGPSDGQPAPKRATKIKATEPGARLSLVTWDRTAHIFKRAHACPRAQGSVQKLYMKNSVTSVAFLNRAARGAAAFGPDWCESTPSVYAVSVSASSQAHGIKAEWSFFVYYAHGAFELVQDGSGPQTPPPPPNQRASQA
ncbi:hypothetical protein AOLI_G00296130 [Acnodon oligacanthus]